MICAIMQPTFIPWIGYFDMIDKVDVFVFLDDVQLAKRSWQVRNRIKTQQGELFLNIPIRKTKSRDEQLISNALLNNDEKWKNQHLKSIQNAYRKAPFYDEIYPFLELFYVIEHQKLSEFTTGLIKVISDKIGINTQLITSSELDIQGVKDKKLARICKYLNCDKYLSPQGSAAYIESEKPGGEIVGSGIELFYFNYSHPTYNQQYPPFLPYCGIIDVLFNVGIEKSLSIIRSGRMFDIDYKEFRSSYLQNND